MATVEEYGSGKILHSIRLAHIALRVTGVLLFGPIVAAKMEQRMEPFAICPITLGYAGSIIGKCRCCAAGSRVCQPLFPASPVSESVFLDELAERMVEAGKARTVTKEGAVSVLGKYPDKPLLLSKVSGGTVEISRSEPSVCIYWKMRRGGLKV